MGCLALSAVMAIDNGLGRKPPMGWRSWNLYGGSVNQDLIEVRTSNDPIILSHNLPHCCIMLSDVVKPVWKLFTIFT